MHPTSPGSCALAHPPPSLPIHRREYAELCERTESVDASLVRTIDADVPRTPLEDDESRRLLRQMLLAHCVLERSWGYFQGMADVGQVAIKVAREGGASEGGAFRLLRGLLLNTADNWAHADLDGIWQQHRTVFAVLRLVDRPLANRLAALDSTADAGSTGKQPLAFLFGVVFLRLKRELCDLEEVMRLWEVCWATSEHFHLLVVAALVRSQRKAILSRQTRRAAELHQLFGRLHGTQRAAPLLRAAPVAKS